MEKGKLVKKLSGMTQEQLAEKLNVSRQTISKWESTNDDKKVTFFQGRKSK